MSKLFLIFTCVGLCFNFNVLASPIADTYGPVNLSKTLKTPFNSHIQFNNATNTIDQSITLNSVITHRNLVSNTRLYLPGTIFIGRVADFIIKARPGAYVALAMADRDSGASTILGNKIRLGVDRKVVGVGVVPSSGVYNLAVEIPIEGDLIGQYLYFVAVSWTKPDFSDLEIAEPITAEKVPLPHFNGVIVQNLVEEAKKGIKFVPDKQAGIMFPGVSTGKAIGEIK